MTTVTSIARRRCLLIAPLSFYSFARSVAQGLEQRGYEVELLNEEYPANSFGKVLGKLGLPLLRRLTLKGLQRELSGRKPYDLALIIKGRGLGTESIGYLKTQCRRIVAYNFDSFRFNPSPLDWKQLTDRFATFDIEDAAKTGTPLVHLFSSASTPVKPEREYDISIVQRVHSDRLAYADMLLAALPAGTRSFVFLYESSPLTFALGLLRHPLLYRRLWNYISFKPLPYAEAMEALGNSRVTFDFAHPHQSGITVRCFEAQSLGVAVLTNNPAAATSSFFAPGSIALLPRQANSQAVADLVQSLQARLPTPRRRSLNDFLDDLLAETADPDSPAPSFAGDPA
jgi:hypothetical protein